MSNKCAIMLFEETWCCLVTVYFDATSLDQSRCSSSSYIQLWMQLVLLLLVLLVLPLITLDQQQWLFNYFLDSLSILSHSLLCLIYPYHIFWFALFSCAIGLLWYICLATQLFYIFQFISLVICIWFLISSFSTCSI